MLFVFPSRANREVAKTLGHFSQAVKLKHAGGKGKPRKNMPGYTYIQGLHGHYWHPDTTVTATHHGVAGKAHYIQNLARPGDVIAHGGENHTVLGRLHNQLVVLDPKNSHVKLSSMQDDEHAIVRHHIPDLFEKDPVLLQRKIMGRYLSVKDILDHPDNFHQAHDLHANGLLKLPPGVQLSHEPNLNLNTAPQKPTKKKKTGTGDLNDVTEPEDQEPTTPIRMTRFEPGEVFKMQDYIHNSKLGDVILTSKDTHWTVVGTGHIRSADPVTGKREATGHPVVLVHSDKLNGIYALQVGGNNRTYTMVSHGNDDPAVELAHAQKEIIEKSKGLGFTLAQLKDGSYVSMPPKGMSKINMIQGVSPNSPASAHMGPGASPGVNVGGVQVPQANLAATKPSKGPKSPGHVDLDLSKSTNDVKDAVAHAQGLLSGKNTSKVAFVVKDAAGNRRHVIASRTADGHVSLSSTKIPTSKFVNMPGHLKGGHSIARLIHGPSKGKTLLDEIVSILDSHHKSGLNAYGNPEVPK
jgi:hypothetical protein